MKPVRVLTMSVLTGLAVLMCAPVAFLFAGVIMDSGELRVRLGPVLLENQKGFAFWSLLPQSPSLSHLVELLLDSPEFFHMFSVLLILLNPGFTGILSKQGVQITGKQIA